MTAPSAVLMLLVDSRSPAGTHYHSGGMESAVVSGMVQSLVDVEMFCRGRLLTTGAVVAAAAAHACRLAVADPNPDQWRDLDQQVTARTPSEATRAASRALGSGLLRLGRSMLAQLPDRAWWGHLPEPGPHHPLVLGGVCAVAGGSVLFAARAAALATCTTPASAAVRLLGFDPYAVQTMLARLGPEIDTVASQATVTADIPSGGSPALDLLADVHVRSEVRLFAS